MIHLHFSRWRKLLIALAIIGFLFAVCQILPSENNGKPHLETLESASDVPLIIWWTPLVEGGYESRRICDLSNICRFTTKRDKLGDAGVSMFNVIFSMVCYFYLGFRDYVCGQKSVPLIVKFLLALLL